MNLFANVIGKMKKCNLFIKLPENPIFNGSISNYLRQF